MNRHSVLVLSLLAACSSAFATACSDSDDGESPATGGTSSTAGSGGAMTAGALNATGGMSPSGGGAGGSVAAGGVAGSAVGGSTTAGSGGAEQTCDILGLQIFSRSDLPDATWDDNDFSDASLEGICPRLVKVTWPHEEGWQNADPAEANFESTRITLDSSYTSDLTNKELTLTIELTADERGPMATAGAYIVSLVSVSTYDIPPENGGGGAGGGGGTAGAAGAEAGGVSGGGGTAGVSGGGGTAGVSGGGGTAGASGGGDTAGVSGGGGSAGATAGSGGIDASAGTAGAMPMPMPMPTLGYAEAESAIAQRATLNRVGDRATLTLRLPNKTMEADSYDPTRPVKVNVRIYSAFTGGSTMDVGGESGAAGMSGAGGMGDAETGDAGGPSDAAAAGGMSGGGGGMSGAPGANGGTAGSGGTAPVYDYLTSEFTITNFAIKDVAP